MRAAHFDCMSNCNMCTYAHTKIQSIVLDTATIEEKQLSSSTVIQHFFSAEDVHNHLNAKLCPIYSPINKF